MTDEGAREYDVFISYRWTSPDKEWVRNDLYPALEAAGLRPLLDVMDFVPGRDVILEMTRARQSARTVLSVVTPDYFDGDRMGMFEALAARASNPTGSESRLIPLILRPVDLPEWMRLVPVDWTSEVECAREWKRLLRTLGAPNLDAPSPRCLAAAPASAAAPSRPRASAVKRSSEVLIEHVRDVKTHRALIQDALDLYEERIPAEERYDREQMISLIRRHLSTEFGPDWTMHLLLATNNSRCVGMLLCYEQLSTRLAFISYLIARNVRGAGGKVSQLLADGLVDVRQRSGLPEVRFVFEIEDPRLTEDVRERRRRLSRFKLFADLAPFVALHVRALDVPYLQPCLEDADSGQPKQLLLCYVCGDIRPALPKPDAADILRWTYTQLYGDDIFQDADTRRRYAQHTRALLDRVVSSMPEQVRLLRHKEVLTAPLRHALPPNAAV